MHVFLSWSGKQSREVALALREWLPGVINSVDPFVSAEDIDVGTRWQAEIAGQLEKTSYGIICVTRENQEAPWLNFEAGALAKTVDTSHVVPLAIDLGPSEIKQPLGQFQAQEATKEGIHKIVRSLNEAGANPLPSNLLEKSFEKWWPDLETRFREIGQQPEVGRQASEVRSDRELLEETLETVRRLARDQLPVWQSLSDVMVIPHETRDRERALIHYLTLTQREFLDTEHAKSARLKKGARLRHPVHGVVTVVHASTKKDRYEVRGDDGKLYEVTRDTLEPTEDETD